MALAVFNLTGVNPPFQVDLRKCVQPPEVADQNNRIQNAARRVFEVVTAVTGSFVSATSSTIKNSLISFQIVVFRRYWIGDSYGYRLPDSFAVLTLSIVLWAAGLFYNIVYNTYQISKDKLQTSEGAAPILARYAPPEMDVRHIQTAESEIDVSHIKQSVQVANLVAMFDEINFTDPNAPGYMSPLSRTVDRNGLTTPGDLRTHLEKFVANVEGRIPFIGTPPGSDVERLHAFYQQIENAVRWSINKVNSDLEAFQRVNGVDPGVYDAEALQKYKDLLENRARVPLMLAIAGMACGARYMGEAMELFFQYKTEGTTEGTLQQLLFEFLASKRKEVATMCIQEDLGAGTHDYAQYMSQFGEVLGLPGTKNVVEYLSWGLSASIHLRKFFEIYTLRFIVDSINEMIKDPKSGILREKIVDWLRSRASHWKEAEVARKAELLYPVVNPILQTTEIRGDFNVAKNLQLLIELLNHLKQQPGFSFPEIEGSFDEFMEELFSSDAARAWFETKVSNLELRREVALMKNEIMSLFEEDQLGVSLFEQVKGALQRDHEITGYDGRILLLQKAGDIASTLGLPSTDTAIRIVQGEFSLRKAILDKTKRDRDDEFIELLDLERLDSNGLNDQLLLWILVSEGIVTLPQDLEARQ